MIGKRKLIAFVMLVALTVFGVLNLDTARVSAYESPAIYISPAYVNAVEAIGANYTFDVLTDYDGSDVWGFEFDLTFNPIVLECREILNGGLIDETIMWYGEFNNTEGTMHVSNSFQTDPPPADPPVTSGPGKLANITFTVVGSGTSNITFVERDTKLIGAYEVGETWVYYNIVDDTPIGHIEGSRLDSTTSRDVAVTEITVSRTPIPAGDPSMFGYSHADINVTVENQGASAENFDLNVYRNTTVIHSENLNLAAQTSTLVAFTWDTSSITAYGNYILSANVTIVPNELDTADNNIIFGEVSVTIPGDVTATFPPSSDVDFKVKWQDLFTLAAAYGSKPGDALWNPNCDISDDSKVGWQDLFSLAAHYGQQA